MVLSLGGWSGVQVEGNSVQKDAESQYKHKAEPPVCRSVAFWVFAFGGSFKMVLVLAARASSGQPEGARVMQVQTSARALRL
eukprot:2160643-Rhodomonas_salina.3